MGEEVDEEWAIQVFAQLVENKPVIKEVKGGIREFIKYDQKQIRSVYINCTGGTTRSR